MDKEEEIGGVEPWQNSFHYKGFTRLMHLAAL